MTKDYEDFLLAVVSFVEDMQSNCKYTILKDNKEQSNKNYCSTYRIFSFYFSLLAMIIAFLGEIIFSSIIILFGPSIKLRRYTHHVK